MTSYSSNSTINAQKSDGYAPGSLTSLSVGTSGVITGSFTNGQTAEVAQVKVANFAAPDGLQGIGSNLYAQTPASGTPTVNNPGDAGTGLITAGSLEMSNVDISSEFINMITAQKAYEASAHVITTEDTLIEDLMNLKTS
jgi:flagellar hook protein FlgE